MANTAEVVSLFRLTPRALQVQSEAISRALDSPAAPVQDMGVDHRRAHVLMAQQLLDRPNIIPVLQQVGRKGVAKRMAACRFGDPCFQSGFLEAPLQDGFVQVVPALFAGDAVGVVACGGKDPLPLPLLPRVLVLPRKGVGQGDTAQPSPEIVLMLALDHLQMTKERLLCRRRQRSVAVLISLAGPNHDLLLREVDVLHS